MIRDSQRVPTTVYVVQLEVKASRFFTHFLCDTRSGVLKIRLQLA